MIFVFDLDHTLLDTEKLVRAYVRDKLRPLGVTRPMYDRAIRLEKSRRAAGVNTTVKTIFQALGSVTKRTYSVSAQRTMLRYFRTHANDFFYPDVPRVIPKLAGRKILLTKGERSIQNAKLVRGKIKSLFDRIYVTPSLKAGELGAIAKRFAGETIIFVDDRHEEHRAALKAVPRLVSVHIVRRGRRAERLAHPRCFVVQNLQQLKKLAPLLSALKYGNRRR